MKKMCLVAVLLAAIAGCDRGAGKPKAPETESEILKRLLVPESPDLVGQWVHRSDGGIMVLVIREKDGLFSMERRSEDGANVTVELAVRNTQGQRRFVDTRQPPGMYLVVNRAGDLELNDGRRVLRTMPAAKRSTTGVAPGPRT
jgi:hypothetical protein